MCSTSCRAVSPSARPIRSVISCISSRAFILIMAVKCSLRETPTE